MSVIGRPISHSLSPLLHVYCATRAGLKVLSFKCELADDQLTEFIQAARGEPMFLGFNVTMPFKRMVVPMVDRCSPEVERIGVVNTVVKRREAFEGHNTDWAAVRSALESRSVFAENALVIGAGGAASAAVYALTASPKLASEVFVWNRTRANSHELASRFGVAELAENVPPPEFDLVVNATPLNLGMERSLRRLWEGAAVKVDFNYAAGTVRPRSGESHVDGLELLARQAASGASLFFGSSPREDELIEYIRGVA